MPTAVTGRRPFVPRGKSRVRSLSAVSLAVTSMPSIRILITACCIRLSSGGGMASCAHTLAESCRDGECHPNNELCPPVTTDKSCGEIPHSGRDGAVLTWGLTYRTEDAQECCDRCKAHPRKCNSWTFCGLPVCWGLDTGHNHTYGECWLRRLKDVQANSSFRQRGKYTAQWLKQHRRSRPGCKSNQFWACSPTHVPYTSGALGGPAHDPSAQFVTGGGWGKVFVKGETEYLAELAGGPGAAGSAESTAVSRRAARRLTRTRRNS